MKINWFSPLPPTSSGIADYTVRLLPFLRERAEVTLWTDQQEWDEALDKICEVCVFDPGRVPWHEMNRADATVYHMGNHPHYHGAIWRVSRQLAGTVVLHDLRLHHFFMMLYSEAGAAHEYLSQMERYYGRHGVTAAESLLNGGRTLDDMSADFPLTGLAIENALGVLVHTREAFDRLKSEAEIPVALAPLAYSASRATDQAAAQRKRDGGPPYNLILFGHLGSNRRIEVLLGALADFPQKDAFRLDIYGSMSDPEQVRSLAEALGLGGIVQVHGLVPEAQLDAALESSHLAINLRYPTMGEASLSQLRIWEYALPSLVTRTGWYADLSPDTVAFVRIERESLDIQEHLRGFLDEPARFELMGQKGRRVVLDQHAPPAYVRALIGIIEAGRDLGPSKLAVHLADLTGRVMSRWSSAGLPGEAFSKPAEEIHRLLTRRVDRSNAPVAGENEVRCHRAGGAVKKL